MAEKTPLLDILNPLKDMDRIRNAPNERGEVLIMTTYRNAIRGALFGALAGTVLDQTVGNGDPQFAIYLGLCGAVTDAIQTLGRGAIQITGGNKSN
ncbi:MAG: hypothetical protein AAB383_01880 [Patescibacteria group bacterium]